ncbi:MAG: hypothetical protein ABI745_12310 [Caldimonas sp.]
MTARSLFLPSLSVRLRAVVPSVAALVVGVVLTACGGSADAPPPTGPVVPVLPTPPVITQQPADLSVTVGQAAGFTVAATGTAPLSYQWQRNGADIAGATGTAYAIGTTVLGDSGATFRAVVSNAAGSATSNSATLTVTATAPVLTISPQPANAAVVAGAPASFTVGGTCSSGTLQIQWQRLAGAAFADIAGATSATYNITTALTDTGAQFRAALSCSGQAATTSSVATLTVSAPSGVTLSLYPLNGLRDQARINGVSAVDRLADGSTALFVGSQLKRLSTDRLSITPITGTLQTGYLDGPAATAQFRTPLGIAHDAAGVIYVADTQNHVIRRVATDGTVSTLAGTAGMNALTDGTGSAARFSEPTGIVLAPDGDLYVADRGNNAIRRVTTAGVVTTYAGSGTAGFADGAAASARFSQPYAVAAAANGDLIVSDRANNRVRRVLRAGAVAGLVETLAGSGVFATPGADGIGAAAEIGSPGALTLQGNAVFVLDFPGLIRQIDLTTRVVSTFAGSRTLGSGYADGPLGAAQFRGFGYGITAGTAGGLVVGDDIGLRSVDASGNVTTIASRNGDETDAGTGVLLQLPLQAGSIAVDSLGRVANYDAASRAVRRVDSSGNVTLVAGLTGSYAGVVDGMGSAAQFGDAGLSITAGPGNTLYVGDSYVLRRIASDGTVTTLAGSTAAFGGVDGTGAAARFNRLFGLAVGPGGDVFVGDAGNNAIRRVDTAGNVTTYAGVMGVAAQIDGPIATARLRLPYWVTRTPDGTIWFADGSPVQSLRKISADGSTVSTILSPGSGISALASDSAGIVYYMVPADLVLPGGLFAYDPATGTSTRLIIAGTDQQIHLGSVNPSLPVVRSIAVLGPKRILISGGTQLLLLTLP